MHVIGQGSGRGSGNQCGQLTSVQRQSVSVLISPSDCLHLTRVPFKLFQTFLYNNSDILKFSIGPSEVRALPLGVADGTSCPLLTALLVRAKCMCCLSGVVDGLHNHY